MENKSELTITEIDNLYQSMSAAELWQRSKDVEPLQVKFIEPVVSPKTIQGFSIEETAEYIQSLSIAEIEALFANGRRVQINWAEEIPDDEDDFVQLPSNAYAIPETELPQLAEGFEPVYGNKSKRISKEKMAQIAGLPYDEMYRKHEQGRWAKDDTPPVFEILGKPIVLNPFLENDNFELISAALSPDEQYMFVLLRDSNSQFTYTANAKWHEATGIYVTMVYHSNYIADWDKGTTTFEEKISWF